MTIGSGLAQLSGYSFEVRYSDGAQERARISADITADAYGYFGDLFSGVAPDLALIVAGRDDWESRQPYGLPFFNNDDGQIRPGILVMPANQGDFWVAMGEELRATTPTGYAQLLTVYPDGAGGIDLQPFFDLVTIHELGHAFEVFGNLQMPTFWLGEIFANLALHAYVATRDPDQLERLETLSVVGANSPNLDARMHAEGFTSLDDLETNYTGGDTPMDPLNYVWYQYRWQRLAAAMFDADGVDSLVRFWNFFRSTDRSVTLDEDGAALASVLGTEISETFGRAIRDWR